MPHVNEAVWVWDLYPLSRRAWPNQQIETNARPGHEVDLEKREAVKVWRSAAARESESSLCIMDQVWGIQRGGYESPQYRTLIRKHYRATDDDLAILQRIFPNADSQNPSWPNVEAELIAGGRVKSDLQAMNAPALLRLLGGPVSSQRGAAGSEPHRECVSRYVLTACQWLMPSYRNQACLIRCFDELWTNALIRISRKKDFPERLGEPFDACRKIGSFQST